MSTNFRVLVQFDGEKSVFVARAPELEHCTAEGASRAEAIAKLEEEIGATVANIRERGGRPPVALDDAKDELSGDIAAKVSRTLQRELLWQAKNEGVELSQLVGEMLAAGLDARRRAGGGRRPAPQGQSDANGNRDDRGQRRGGGGAGGGRYHNIMEDRASFVEYVRSLDQGQGQGGGRGPGGGGGRGRGGGGGGGGGGRGPGGGGRGPGGGGRGPGGGGGGPGPAGGGPGPGDEGEGGGP